jgi:hypothetical protein
MALAALPVAGAAAIGANQLMGRVGNNGHPHFERIPDEEIAEPVSDQEPTAARSAGGRSRGTGTADRDRCPQRRLEN